MGIIIGRKGTIIYRNGSKIFSAVKPNVTNTLDSLTSWETTMTAQKTISVEKNCGKISLRI